MDTNDLCFSNFCYSQWQDVSKIRNWDDRRIEDMKSEGISKSHPKKKGGFRMSFVQTRSSSTCFNSAKFVPGTSLLKEYGTCDCFCMFFHIVLTFVFYRHGNDIKYSGRFCERRCAWHREGVSDEKRDGSKALFMRTY